MYLWNLERKIKLLSPSLLILKIVRGSQFDYNYSYSTEWHNQEISVCVS